tara:strand:+ start:320 stop:907 length:588 start_codon:yes stop_codon:yes gene_type:complete
MGGFDSPGYSQMIEIPQHILDFASATASFYTPLARRSGFNETKTQRRGDGDLSDLIGTLIVFELLARENKICKIELCSGDGDESDLEIRVGGQYRKVNIKTSLYAPYRDGLNLYVKEEELDKAIDAYIQVFVHLNEGKQKPHVHIAGWCAKESQVWKDHQNVINIPNTGGHLGIGIPVQKLGSLASLKKAADTKF